MDNFYARYPATGGAGSVTSVGLSLPSIFNVTGSPVTMAGTLTATFINESANTVFSGPASGASATPTFRLLVPADIPNISSLYANVNLSNLASPTSINQDLLPSANAARQIGSASLGWLKGWIESIDAGSVPLTLNGNGIVASTNLIHNVVDPVSAQDAATKNYVDNGITKTPNTFAGFDGAGLLETVPGFFINTATGGMDINLTEQPNNGGGFTINGEAFNFDPLQNSPNENWNIYNIGVNFDVNNSGFSQGTSGNAVQLLNLGINHNGTGSIGGVVYHNLTGSFGNGIDPITVKGMNLIGSGTQFHANVTIDGQLQGYSFNPSVDSAAIGTSAFSAQVYNDSANIQIPINNYFSANLSPNLLEISNNSNYIGANVNPNIATLTGNANAEGFSFNGSYGTTNTGGVTGASFNPSITTMGATSRYHGLDILGNITTSHGDVQGININTNVNGGDANFTGININPGGTATLPQIQGININLSNLASTQMKVGLTTQDAAINVSALYDTSLYPASPGFLQINGIGGEYRVAPGFPVSNTLVFGDNLGVASLFEDDMGPDSFGGFIGYASVGFLSQLAVATGKTVDTVTSLLVASSVPGISVTGGTVTNANVITAVGPLNQGGTLNIINLKGLNIPSIFNSYLATNAWGVYVADTTVDNWFAKNVVIGGVTAKPTSSDALDLTGDMVMTGVIHDTTTNETIDPNNRHLITNGYNIVDWANQTLTDLGGNTMFGWSAGYLDAHTNLISNVVDPVSAQDAATKAYVDTVASSLNPIQAAQAASVSNVAGTYANGVAGVGATFTTTSVATFTLDGYTPTLLQRVLLKNQTSGFQNGVYNVTQLATGVLPAILTRSLDYNTPATIDAGDLIPIVNGTVNALTSWLQTAAVTTVGTDALVFVEWTANPSSYLLKANNLSDVASASLSFKNISPLTTVGDIIYEAAGPTPARLPIGSTNDVLTVIGGVPVWQAPGGSSGSPYDLTVGPTQTYTTIGAAITAASAGQSIFIQTGTYTENPVVNKQLNITGSGRGVIISGSLTFATSSDESIMTQFKVTGGFTINSGVNGVMATNWWNGSSSTYTDNGTGTYVQFMQE